MQQTVKHLAVVEEIGSDRVIVSIEQKSACSGCHAASYCCSVDCREHLVSAFKPVEPVSVGEQVELEGREALGWLAILISFILPLVVLVSVLAVCVVLRHLNDLISAGIALCATMLYYTGVGVFGKKLSKTFVFTIKKINRSQVI